MTTIPKKHDLSSLRICITGGSPVPQPIVKRFEELSGVRVAQVYGSTETCGQNVIEPTVGLRKPGAAGLPVGSSRLGDVPYLGGDEYSIADIATFPWVLVQSRRLGERFPFLDRNSVLYPNLAVWLERCEERPGAQQALAVHAKMTSAVAAATPEDLDRMFGRGKYAYRG